MKDDQRSICIGVCTLKDDGTCIGCGRTIAEITAAYDEYGNSWEFMGFAEDSKKGQ
jgi:predicted Fe-S protein YdhL (DUF1289 family)